MSTSRPETEYCLKPSPIAQLEVPPEEDATLILDDPTDEPHGTNEEGEPEDPKKGDNPIEEDGPTCGAAAERANGAPECP